MPAQTDRVYPKWHKTLSILAVSVISFAGLESLAYIENLYQQQIYLEAAGWIYFFLIVWLTFIFDLHFRERDFTALTLWRALWKRFKHFRKWEHLRFFQNYLILPGLLYWGAVVLIGINFNHTKLQQFVVVVTSAALVLCYAFFKEVFRQRQTPLNNAHFVALTYVKLYAAWLVYSASLGIVWYYCFQPFFFYTVIFLVTWALLYQALFQFDEVRLRNVALAAGIALAVAVASYFVYKFWNVNYFSAGLFMTAVYNLLWSLLYHALKKTLSARVVMEQIAIFVLILVMVFGVTNFQARIDRCGF